MGALRVTLTESERKTITERLAHIPVVGERYAPDLMALSQTAWPENANRIRGLPTSRPPALSRLSALSRPARSRPFLARAAK